MVTPDVTALQRSDLNQFLFADVGMEANGMTLSVMSMLARQGSDPWREAGRLAELTRAEATDVLAWTIAGMPRSLWSLPDAVAIAVRLTGLLPERPARAPLGGAADGWAFVRAATIAICVALAVAYAVMTMVRPDPQTKFDGSDVGSFTGVTSGNNVAKGKQQ